MVRPHQPTRSWTKKGLARRAAAETMAATTTTGRVARARGRPTTRSRARLPTPAGEGVFTVWRFPMGVEVQKEGRVVGGEGRV